jgi:glycosyltransferase involved in cell wall biosynthesis
VSVTFAVIGRNEAPTLRIALLQALDAARPGDRVVFVDGASSDRSDAIADALGVEVVQAGLGKGRAIAAAGRTAAGSPLCTIDADIEHSERNIPAALRDEFERSGADMVVSNIVERNRVRIVVPGLYRPLVGALFPEAVDVAGRTPLSGFRMLAPGRIPKRLPSGFGVETHLNIRFAVDGLRVKVMPAFRYHGPYKAYANVERMAHDIVEAILDLAVAEGRLEPSVRAEWEAWAQAVIEHGRALPVPMSGRSAFEDRVMELGARPLPPPWRVAVGQ